MRNGVLCLALRAFSNAPRMAQQYAREDDMAQNKSEIRLQTPARLIGRGVAMQTLTSALARSLDGDPAIVLVSGEAGVGKTRLVRELAAVAEQRGAQVCMSRCIEGSSVPYLPFVSALLPRLERAGLVGEGDTLQLLRPGHRRGETDGAIDRTPELYIALPRATFELAALRPLLLVVDDVHWADPSTLGVLEHLVLSASDEAGQRDFALCLVLVHRNLPSGSEPARLAARLRREHIVESVAVKGLDELELNDLLWDAAGGPVAPPLLTALHRATGGNPLFAMESLKLLSSEGSLRRRGDFIVSDSDPAELSIQNEVTAAIDERARALATDTADLLTAAALIGDEAPLDLLAVVAEVGREALIDLLALAVTEGFINETEAGIRFAHPIVRRVFGRRWPVSRRRRTHLRIADVLSTGDAVANILEIATHLKAAGPLADPVKQGGAAARAGERAYALSAWGEAARFYREALESQEYREGLSVLELAALTYRCGQALYRNLDISASLVAFLSAAQLYREAGNALGRADALVGWMRAQISHDLSAGARLVDSPEIKQFLDETDGTDRRARAHLEAQIAEVFFALQRPEAKHYAARALAVGEDSGDAFLTLHAADTLALASWQALDPEAALAHHTTALAVARELGDPWFEAWPLQRMPLALAALGRLKEAEGVARDATELFERTHDWAEHSLTLATATALATLRGDFELAERSAAGCMLMFRRSSYVWSPGIVFPALIQARLARGDIDGAAHAVDLWRDAGAAGLSWIGTLLCMAHRGEYSRLSAELSAHAARVQRPLPVGMMSLGALCMRVEVAALSGERDIAQGARETLAEAVNRGVLFSLPLGAYLIPRVLGDLALLEGELDEAAQRYEAAIAAARMSRARAELAHACFGLGRVLMSNGTSDAQSRGSAYLSEAMALFEDLGMQGWLNRAREIIPARDAAAVAPLGPRAGDETDLMEQMAKGLTKRDIAARLLLAERAVGRRLADLKASTGVGSSAEARAYLEQMEHAGLPPSPAPRERHRVLEGGLRLVLVSDIVGSTQLNEALGDEQWVHMLREHNEIVREQLLRFDGSEVKHTGDGIFAWFPSASDALNCALAVAGHFPIFHRGGTTIRADVCVGISAGEPVLTENDLVGLSVTQAFRICDRARPGEVLVSDTVRRLADGSPFEFRSRGRLALKGFRERTQVHSVLLPIEATLAAIQGA